MKTSAKSYIILYSTVAKSLEMCLHKHQGICSILSKETISSYQDTLTSERNMTKCVHTTGMYRI